MKRPERKYTHQDAQQNATKYITDALHGVPEHDCFINPFPNAILVIGLATTLLTFAHDDSFGAFCAFLIKCLWDVVTAGDNKPLQYQEILVTHFHHLRISQNLLSKWDNLLEGLNLHPQQIVNDLLLQHLLDVVLESLLLKRHSVDLPEIEKDIIAAEKMNKDEEKVLSYVAGYIPFSLHKHYMSMKNNASTSKFIQILSNWACTGPFDRQYTFLEYTKDWIETQSNGGLFQPNAQVFIFFRALENETRKHLSVNNVNKCTDNSLKDVLFKHITKSHLIQQYWMTLAGSDLTPAENRILLKTVVNFWIKIRCGAFVIVYVDLRKLRENLK